MLLTRGIGLEKGYRLLYEPIREKAKKEPITVLDSVTILQIVGIKLYQKRNSFFGNSFVGVKSKNSP